MTESSELATLQQSKELLSMFDELANWMLAHVKKREQEGYL